MLDLDSLIEEAAAALRAAEQERSDLRKAQLANTQKRRELAEELRGLRLARARRGGAPVEPEEPNEEPPNEDSEESEMNEEPRFIPVPASRAMTRTDAILMVLRDADGPRSPKAISQLLHERGRDDPTNLVSAAINHLRRQGRVESRGYGLWGIPGRPDKEAEEVGEE